MPRLILTRTAPKVFARHAASVRKENHAGRQWQRAYTSHSKLDAEHPLWVERAQRVKDGKEKSLVTVLGDRGYIKEIAGPV